MNLNDLLQFTQLKAIEGKLTNSVAYFERKVRRWYSQTFSTPLKDTYQISFDDILLNYYEHLIDEADYETLYNLAVDLTPELAELREQEDEEFARSLEELQERTIKKRAKGDMEYASKLENATQGFLEAKKRVQSQSKKLNDQISKNDRPVQNININFEDEEGDL